MPRARVSVDDVQLLIGLTAAVEGLIRAQRPDPDEGAVIARHVDEPDLALEETLARLNRRLRALAADESHPAK